ncbi:MAG: ABC transporter substrate-binding protein [Chloroflexi bacterium]|nr:ABC transporter substrate-binding protein [Chloroflexota bacterium]MCL5026201.1 ABC transporter substrate-binding protein [Chloroflexota bacterium]
MSNLFARLFAIVTIIGLLAACAAPAAPTAVPTKPAAPAAPTTAPQAPAVPTAGTATVAPTSAPAAKVKRGGTIVVSSTSPSTLDPLFTTNSSPLAEAPMYEALLRYDMVDLKTGKHEVRPELAESYKIVDPKTIELKLRRGVKFHDGSDFNVEVAKWNLDRMKNHPKSMSKHLVDVVNTVEIADPYTLLLKLEAPSATQLLNLTRATGGTGSSGSLIVSKAAVEKLGEEAFGSKPSATGPMMFVDWKRDDSITMKKFDGYWGKSADGQPLPYVDGVTTRIIADRAVALIEVKAGTVHIVSEIAGKDIATVKSNPEMVYWEMPWGTNFNPYAFSQQKTEFAGNLKLRQAAAYALDREAIAKTLGFGAGTANYYPLWNTSFPGYDESLPKYDFNLQKATQLMNEAGYPDGLDFSMSIQASGFNQSLAEMVQSMWSKIKLRVAINSMELLAWRQHMKAGGFDSTIYGMTASPDPDLYSRMWVTDRPSNWPNYSNRELDKCLEEGRSIYDEKQRHEIYKRCQKIIYDDAFIGGTLYTATNIVYRKEVKGVRAQSRVLDVAEAWLDK